MYMRGHKYVENTEFVNLSSWKYQNINFKQDKWKQL